VTPSRPSDHWLRRRARRGDLRARDELIGRYIPLADRLARKHRRRAQPLDDLIQVARLGLVKAASRWDADRGTTFPTYAVPTIVGELRRYYRDATWAVRPPRDLQELHLRALRARGALVQQLGREPSAADLAHDLQCSRDEVAEALQAGDAHEARSLDRPLANDDGSASTYVSALADTRPDIARCEMAVTVAQLTDVLSPRDREVVRLRFQEDLIQREIARRIGCSQMHVSRILRESVRRMRAAAEAPL
jgi:RNA polymerase sigma-B factor